MITILLVDDHALVRRGFRRLIEDEPDLQVVGEAGDGLEAVALAASLRPQVIVMDYALPGINGALATRQILAAQPSVAILILSMHSEPQYVANSVDAGARGYLMKNALDLELVDAIRRLAAGEKLLDPKLEPEDGKRRGLTTRELEVLQHIVAGHSNKEIAHRLNLSVHTISVHRAHIMDQLGLHNAAELVAYAIRHGLVTNT
ncbi:MAG: response regulator transcription factor [Bryobacteraceae bacterium]|nr:response regulator transcription factor [Bryobacteraceae bacterium]